MHSALRSVLAGVNACVNIIGNVGDGNFRPSFLKSNISAMDRLVVVKFHANIAK